MSMENQELLVKAYDWAWKAIRNVVIRPNHKNFIKL